jgi:hypothetical protein
VLLRRDDVEHLVMIGGGSDVLLEANISRDRETRARENIAVDYPRAVPGNEPQAEFAAPPVAAGAAVTPEPEERQREVTIEPDTPMGTDEPFIPEPQPVEPEPHREDTSAVAAPRPVEVQAEKPREPERTEKAEVAAPTHRDPDVPVTTEFERQEFPANAAARKAEISRSKELPRQPVKSGSEVEDEMQRLLDELSGR